jgi:hypothetical protein
MYFTLKGDLCPIGSYKRGAGKPPSFKRGMRAPFLVRGRGGGCISTFGLERKKRDTQGENKKERTRAVLIYEYKLDGTPAQEAA